MRRRPLLAVILYQTERTDIADAAIALLSLDQRVKAEGTIALEHALSLLTVLGRLVQLHRRVDDPGEAPCRLPQDLMAGATRTVREFRDQVRILPEKLPVGVGLLIQLLHRILPVHARAVVRELHAVRGRGVAHRGTILTDVEIAHHPVHRHRARRRVEIVKLPVVDDPAGGEGTIFEIIKASAVRILVPALVSTRGTAFIQGDEATRAILRRDPPFLCQCRHRGCHGCDRGDHGSGQQLSEFSHHKPLTFRVS